MSEILGYPEVRMQVFHFLMQPGAMYDFYDLKAQIDPTDTLWDELLEEVLQDLKREKHIVYGEYFRNIRMR